MTYNNLFHSDQIKHFVRETSASGSKSIGKVNQGIITKW